MSEPLTFEGTDVQAGDAQSDAGAGGSEHLGQDF